MRLVLMIEGQEDVSWDHWLALAQVCEESGFDGLFRSDHYGSALDAEGRAVVVGAKESVKSALLAHLRQRQPVVPGDVLLALDHEHEPHRSPTSCRETGLLSQARMYCSRPVRISSTGSSFQSESG